MRKFYFESVITRDVVDWMLSQLAVREFFAFNKLLDSDVSGEEEESMSADVDE